MENDEELRKKTTKAWGVVENNRISLTASFPKENIDIPGNILPLAMKVAAKTIGQDLVGVKPMSSPGMKDPELLKEAKQILKITNRQIATDNLINDTSNSLVEIEELDKHKEYLNSNKNLFYLDFICIEKVEKVEKEFIPKIVGTSSRYHISTGN